MKKENELLKKLKRKRKFIKGLYDKDAAIYITMTLFGAFILGSLIITFINSIIAGVLALVGVESMWVLMGLFTNEKFEEKLYNKMKSLEEQIVDFEEKDKNITKEIIAEVENKATEVKTISQPSRSLIHKHIKREKQVYKPVYGKVEETGINLGE